MLQPTTEVADDVQRRVIGPLGVVDDDDSRPLRQVSAARSSSM
jgi:hypothetical protein